MEWCGQELVCPALEGGEERVAHNLGRRKDRIRPPPDRLAATLLDIEAKVAPIGHIRRSLGSDQGGVDVGSHEHRRLGQVGEEFVVGLIAELAREELGEIMRATPIITALEKRVLFCANAFSRSRLPRWLHRSMASSSNFCKLTTCHFLGA